MALWKITKGFCCCLLAGFIFLGTLFMIGEAMLNGSQYATFFGYKLSEDFVYDSSRYIHIGDAIIICEVKDYELHHDIPVAYYDDTENKIYIYRIISSEKEEYRVADPSGTIICISKANIIGKVLEH